MARSGYSTCQNQCSSASALDPTQHLVVPSSQTRNSTRALTMSSPSTADAVIYTSSFPPVTDWQEDKGVFEFMFMDKTRPVIRSEVALVDAFTGAETSYGQLVRARSSLLFSVSFAVSLPILICF